MLAVRSEPSCPSCLSLARSPARVHAVHAAPGARAAFAGQRQPRARHGNSDTIPFAFKTLVCTLPIPVETTSSPFEFRVSIVQLGQTDSLRRCALVPCRVMPCAALQRLPTNITWSGANFDPRGGLSVHYGTSMKLQLLLMLRLAAAFFLAFRAHGIDAVLHARFLVSIRSSHPPPFGLQAPCSGRTSRCASWCPSAPTTTAWCASPRTSPT